MKSKESRGKGKKIELDAEVVADLEANDAETDAIQGGRSSSGGSVVGSGVASSAVT